MVRDRLVCRCIIVSEREVRRAIRDGAHSVAAVGERTEAGTGCGSCHGVIEHLLELETHRRQRRPPTPQVGLFGDE